MLLSAIASGSIVQILTSILASLFLIFCVIPVHEFAHAWVAYKMGDNTAKLRGELTLNPLNHIDPLGAILLALIGFGWGKPTPINVRNFKNPKKGVLLTAIAGPVSNLLLGWLLIFILTIFEHVSFLNGTAFGIGLTMFLYISAQLTVYLAVLNLLPVPPFDGFSVLSVFLTDRQYYKMMANQQVISIVVIVLLVTGLLSTPLSWIAGFIMKFFTFMSELPFTLF